VGDHGHRRGQHVRQLEVVEPDQRRPQAGGADRAQRSDGVAVVAGEDRGGRVRQGEQLAGGGLGGGHVVRPELDQ